MKSKGFSLLELLTTIGITGLLAGILAPALIKAKGAAKVTRCIANQKSLNGLLTVAAHDHFPTGMSYFEAKSPGEYAEKYAEINNFQVAAEEEYLYSNLHKDRFLGKYNVYRTELWNCPDTNEGYKTTPFNMLWGWARERKENVAWNYEVDFKKIIFETLPQRDRGATISDVCATDAYEYELDIPHNASFERFKVIFNAGSLHKSKGKGAVQSFKDLSTRWVPIKEIYPEYRP